MELPVGPTSACLSLTVHVFKLPRCGDMRAFFDLHEVFRALRMTSFGGVPSKWVWHSLKSWVAVFTAFGLGQHIVRSTSVADSSDDPWTGRCLPSTCCSTAALLVLLGRWAFVSRENGGLASPENRAAAGEVFGRLVDSALQNNGLKVTLHVAANWQCRWPRLDVVLGDFTVEVSITSGAGVDFSSLIELASLWGEHRVVAKQIMQAFSLTT